MNYQQAIDYFTQLSLIEQKKPNLDRVQAFLSSHGNPQNCFYSFHVGGTNGKGSTVAMLDSILKTTGIKTGRFTGPHILRVNERIHINGQPINDNDFAQSVTELKIKSEVFANDHPEHGPLSWFEFITCLAFFAFARNNIDIAVIEVGMGGTFDATNTLQKVLATGITNVSLDHMHSLGDTLEKIAREKAGIIKPNTPVITAAKDAALPVIAERAKNLDSSLVLCDDQTIHDNLKSIKQDLRQRGLYQYENALLAVNMLTAAKVSVNRQQILAGLKDFVWPGRFQTINSLNLILDCAHNVAGINYLRASLDAIYPNRHFHFLFACYADKNGIAMLKTLLKPGDFVYLITEIKGERPFLSPALLLGAAKEITSNVYLTATITEAFSQAQANRKNNELIIATGSFSVIKATMQSLGWTTVEDSQINELRRVATR